MILDMTKGNPSKILWKFSLPLLLSVAFQQLYNLADSVIAGQFIGEQAMEAVGASYPLTMIFMAFATGANIGISVVVSQLFGAKSYKRMRTAINTSLFAVLGMSAILTVLGLFIGYNLLQLLKTPSVILNDSSLYLNIYIGGLIFLSLYNICTGVFTALGDSRTPLYFLIGSSLGNIGLDILFVVALKMGIAGVAWATFLAQGVSALLASFALIKRIKKLPYDGKPKLFSCKSLKKISIVAIPSILQQAFISIGNIFIQTFVNSFGLSVIGGYSGAIKLNTFAITCFTALANGQSTYAAQNIGSGNLIRVKKGLKAGVFMAFCLALPVSLLFTFGSSFVMRIFIHSGSEEVIKVGSTFLKIVSPFYLIVTFKLMIDSVLRGSGKMVAFMTTTFTDLILRVVLAYFLSSKLRSTGIWMSWPIGWTIATIMSALFFFTGYWKKNLVNKEGT